MSNEKKMIKDSFLDQVIKKAEIASSYVRFAFDSYHDLDDAFAKGKADFVTESDLKAQDILIQELKPLLNDAVFLAEEGNISLKEEGKWEFQWIIDPIDGTSNFIHKFPFVGISIALRHAQKGIVLGIISNIILKDIYYAIEGSGSYKNGKRIFVSKKNSISSSFLATGFPFRHPGIIPKYSALFENLMKKITGLRRAGSAAIDLAMTAEGIFDGFFEYGLKPWDVAAGILLVKEAGGKVTGFMPEQNPLFDSRIIATNGIIHKDLLEEINRIFDE